LEEAKYYMKTKLGVSEAFYQHSTIFPIYGSGQGSGNSPGLWCVISSTLFDLYEEKANGAMFQSPDGKEKIQIYMIGFVDDTSSSINDFLQPEMLPPEHYTELAAQDAQRWNDVLKLSGGALEDTKCSYHFLYYDFTVSGLAVLRGGKFDPTIEIKFNSSTTKIPLKQISAHTAHKTLGCYKSPAGKEKSAYEAIKKRNTTHSNIVARCPLDQTDAWSYYHAILLPSVTYPFPSSTLSNSKCEELQIQIKQAVLPKYGFNRNMPLGVVYGNSEYAGIDMRTLSVEKGLAQLQSLIACLRSEGIPNKLALIAISWAQLLAGTSTPIFQDCKTPLPHLDLMRWLPAIRDFLGKIDGSLEIAVDFVPKLQRENDRFIMDIAIKEMNFKPVEEQLVNACRLYQGVTLLSCITNAAGTSIRGEIFAGDKPTDSKFKGLMPYQDKPSELAWTHWRKVLSYFTHARTTLLKIPMGKWLVTGNDLHREWKYFKELEYSLVYVRHEDHFECYELDRENIFVDTGFTIQNLPQHVVPIDADIQEESLTILPYSPMHIPRIIPEPLTFQEHVATLEQWEQDLMSEVQFLPCVYTFVQKIMNNPIVHCTSDGSAPQFVGSFGWVSSLQTGERIARNKGPAYGFRTSSFRAEGYGVLSYLRLIYRAFEFTANQLPTSLKIHTDSESIVDQVKTTLEFPFYYPNQTLSADWDIIQAIVSTLKQFPRIPPLEWIKGHQDRNRSVQSLSLPAQLNVEADELAGLYRYRPQQNHTRVPRIAGNTVQLHLPGGTIASKLKPAVRKHASLPLTRKSMLKSNKWTVSEFDSIAWEAHGTCFRKHYPRKQFFVKYLHDWLPLGKQVSQYKPHYLSKCPSCDHELEDRDHFLRCPERQQWQPEMIEEVKTFATSFPTRPALTRILLDGLRKWLADQPFLSTDYPLMYQEMIRKQAAAGWNQLFLGRFVKEWIQFQEHSLSTISNRKPNQSGSTWLQGIITIIWKHVHKEWETRNKARHGHDPETQEAARLEQAQRETAEIYATRDDILPEHQDVFYESLEEHFEAEPTALGLRQWLNTWQSTVIPNSTANP
jgi:ribonuclease HI